MQSILVSIPFIVYVVVNNIDIVSTILNVHKRLSRQLVPQLDRSLCSVQQETLICIEENVDRIGLFQI